MKDYWSVCSYFRLVVLKSFVREGSRSRLEGASLSDCCSCRSCLYESPTRTFCGSGHLRNILSVNVCGVSSVETKHNYLEPTPAFVI